jgi:hypothetical protein
MESLSAPHHSRYALSFDGEVCLRKEPMSAPSPRARERLTFGVQAGSGRAAQDRSTGGTQHISRGMSQHAKIICP